MEQLGGIAGARAPDPVIFQRRRQVYQATSRAHRDLGLNLSQVGADGSYCGARMERDRGASSYQWYVHTLRSFYAGEAPVFMRCLTSDFNEKPRYPLLITDQSLIRYQTGQSLDELMQSQGSRCCPAAPSSVAGRGALY